MIFNSLTFIFVCFVPCILLVLITEKAGGRFRIRIQNMILRLKKWLSARLIKNTLMKEKPGFIFSDQSMGGILYGSVIYFRS